MTDCPLDVWGAPPLGPDPLKDLDGSTRQKSYGQGGNDPHRI